MRRYVLSEDAIIEESQMVTTMYPLFDAVEGDGKKNRKIIQLKDFLDSR